MISIQSCLGGRRGIGGSAIYVQCTLKISSRNSDNSLLKNIYKKLQQSSISSIYAEGNAEDDAKTSQGDKNI